jgi:hypothetical protein
VVLSLAREVVYKNGMKTTVLYGLIVEIAMINLKLKAPFD